MTPPSPHSVAIFSLDDRSFALDVAKIEQVVRAVEIAPLPEAPPGVLGIIGVRGRIVPVFDLRVRFGLPSRAVRASDFLLIAHTGRRTVALSVDAVAGVVPASEAHIVASAEILPELRRLEGVMTIAGDIVLIHDLDEFLSAAEDQALAEALRA